MHVFVLSPCTRVIFNHETLFLYYQMTSYIGSVGYISVFQPVCRNTCDKERRQASHTQMKQEPRIPI